MPAPARSRIPAAPMRNVSLPSTIGVAGCPHSRRAAVMCPPAPPPPPPPPPPRDGRPSRSVAVRARPSDPPVPRCGGWGAWSGVSSRQRHPAPHTHSLPGRQARDIGVVAAAWCTPYLLCDRRRMGVAPRSPTSQRPPPCLGRRSEHHLDERRRRRRGQGRGAPVDLGPAAAAVSVVRYHRLGRQAGQRARPPRHHASAAAVGTTEEHRRLRRCRSADDAPPAGAARRQRLGCPALGTPRDAAGRVQG
jgi:hypothetical protein